MEITQKRLAEMTGVTRQTIHSIENGIYEPSIKLCVSICKALNLTLNDLFWEDSDDEK